MNPPQATQEVPTLIGSLEASRRLGVSRHTFNRWVRDGSVTPAGKAEGRTGARLFDAAAIDALTEPVTR